MVDRVICRTAAPRSSSRAKKQSRGQQARLDSKDAPRRPVESTGCSSLSSSRKKSRGGREEGRKGR